MSTTSVKNARTPMQVPKRHYVKDAPLTPPFPDHLEVAILGKGCFWGVEQQFWELDGVFTTAVGYAGGHTMHPTYADVCAGNSGHAEVVLIVYDPAAISFEHLLKWFWQGHRPVRSDGEYGASRDQYRSVIFTTTEEQARAANASKSLYQSGLDGSSRVTTEIAPAPTFFYAETKHQQYLAKRSRR